MPPMEAAQWLGEGIKASEIKKWKDQGLNPFAAGQKKRNRKR